MNKDIFKTTQTNKINNKITKTLTKIKKNAENIEINSNSKYL